MMPPPNARKLRLFGSALLAVAAAVAAALILVRLNRPDGPIQLRDLTGKTGVSFRHTDGSCGRRYLVETVGAGLALFDYDGDGDVDLYFVNAAPLEGAPSDPPPRNALYRNEGNFKFTEVTDTAGVGHAGFGLGVAVGDYNNDGAPDLFVTNYGPNVLYRNNADGTFSDVTEQAGVGGPGKVAAGACFFDMDKDGDLDLYVANYVDFSCEKHVERTVQGVPVYARPTDFDPLPDLLYRNNGDGSFTDVSAPSGVAAHSAAGLGAVCADYDDDGDTDIAVVNDGTGNFLFENDGSGKFQEKGLLSGLAYDADGRELAARGVDAGDYSNDGQLDFFTTSSAAELPVLYENQGQGFFQDVTLATGAGTRSLPHVSWGAGLVDFDNDGNRDLFIACGHFQDNVELFDRSSAYHVRNMVLLNGGNGKFEDVSDRCGDGLLVQLSSRGAAFDDLDNDGDIDVVVSNSRREPTILRNDSAAGNHWIQIRLRGVATNRDGAGARVKVVAGDLVQVDEVHGGRGYLSHYGTRLHFGLGTHDHVDRIEVRWVGGGVEAVTDAGVDRLLTITEGTATAQPQAPNRKTRR